MEARPGCRRGSGGPAHGERRGARALGAAPLAARRRRPPDSVPSAAPSGRRREPPRSSRCGAQRPRRQLLLSHHLAVTASQKRPHLAAAGARDGRGHRPPAGRALARWGWRGPRGQARGAGRGGRWAGRGDTEAKGPGSRRREAGRVRRPHPPPAALNGSARTLGLGSGLPSARPLGEPSPPSGPVLSLPSSPTCRSEATSCLLLARRSHR